MWFVRESRLSPFLTQSIEPAVRPHASAQCFYLNEFSPSFSTDFFLFGRNNQVITVYRIYADRYIGYRGTYIKSRYLHLYSTYIREKKIWYASDIPKSHKDEISIFPLDTYKPTSVFCFIIFFSYLII